MLIIFLATILVCNVAQGKLQEFKCDGIRAKKHGIITTASCVKGLQLSDVHIQTSKGRGDVSQVIRHPKYMNGTSRSHDIAILRLSQPLPPTKNRFKAKIATKLPSSNAKSYIRDCEGKAIPVKILSKKLCSKQKGGKTPDDVICAYRKKSQNIEKCPPMRGAPLISGPYLVGIYTKSLKPQKPLREDGYIYLHTSAIGHRKWIKKVMKDIAGDDGKTTTCESSVTDSTPPPPSNIGQLSLRRSYLDDPEPGPSARESIAANLSLVIPVEAVVKPQITVPPVPPVTPQTPSPPIPPFQTRTSLSLAETQTTLPAATEPPQSPSSPTIPQTIQTRTSLDTLAAFQAETTLPAETEPPQLTRRFEGMTTGFQVKKVEQTSTSAEFTENSHSQSSESNETTAKMEYPSTESTSDKSAPNTPKKDKWASENEMTDDENNASESLDDPDDDEDISQEFERSESEESSEEVTSDEQQEENGQSGVVVMADHGLRVPLVGFEQDGDFLASKFDTKKYQKGDGTVLVRLPKGNRGAFVVFGRN